MLVISWQNPGSTYRENSSWPGWLCQVSGGLPPASRACSTGIALVPLPPAMAALITSTFGLPSLNTWNKASKALASLPEVQYENTSSWLLFSACADERPMVEQQLKTAAVEIRCFMNLYIDMRWFLWWNAETCSTELGN